MLKECSDIAAGVWKAIGARDAGRVDMKIGADGKVQFIEVNPLAGINRDSSDLPILAAMNGISYRQLIGMIMENALKRIKKSNG